MSKKNKKNDVNISNLVDRSIYFSLLLHLIMIIERHWFLDKFHYFYYSISFLVVAVMMVVSNWSSSSKNKVTEISYVTIVDLDNISELLYENNFFLYQKIGDFYAYKSKNRILTSPKVFVKIGEKQNKILTYETNVGWIKEGLEEKVSTTEKG